MAERTVVHRIGAALVSLVVMGTAAGPVWAQPQLTSGDQSTLVAAAPINDSIVLAHPDTTLPVGARQSSPQADYTPVAERVNGRVGDTIVVRLGVTNRGPGSPVFGSFAVVPPAGTTITSIPWEGDDDDRRYACQPSQGKDNYFFLCDLSYLGAPSPGSSRTIGFHIRIDEQIPGAKGSITVYGPNDPVPANDRDAIPVEAAPAPLWRWQNPLWRWQHWVLAVGVLALAIPVGRSFTRRRLNRT